MFDGHGGIDATLFIKNKILNYIVEDSNIPTSIKKTVKNAFVKADHAILNASSLDSSSGTTTLTALITRRLEIVILHFYLSLLIVTWFWCFQTLIDHWSWYNIRGYFYFYDVLFIAIICLTHKCYRTMLIANAGDSRAVLGKRGRVIELDDTRKNYNSLLVHEGSSWSTTSAHGSQDEETRPEPSGKDEFQTSSSWAKPRPEPTRRWIVQTRHWTSHLSVIDKVDGNRCQRRLDELGQTIRC